MVSSEIVNFVRKFHELWSNGFTAHLDLETHPVKAWVGIIVQLYRPFNPQYHSTSRQRRRERRRAAASASFH